LIQHTISTTFTSMKMYFNETYLFQNSPVQPLIVILFHGQDTVIAYSQIICQE
jgi:hypothetical protein